MAIGVRLALLPSARQPRHVYLLPVVWREGAPIMSQDEYKATVAAFIRTKGVTRCPTACAFRTQGTVVAADRAALQDYV